MSEVSRPIQELRDAMERVRKTQEISGIAINMARYDHETLPINERMVEELMFSLPVRPLIDVCHYTKKKYYRGFLIDDPLDISITAAFGLQIAAVETYGAVTNVSENSTIYSGFVVGEKPIGGNDVEFLLAFFKNEPVLDDKEVNIVAVRTPHVAWTYWRDAAFSKLASSPTSEQLRKMYNQSLGQYIMRANSPVRPPRAIIYPAYPEREIRKDVKKHQRKGDGLKYFPGRWSQNGLVSLTSSVIEEYGVMTQLEYLAAAYGKGEEWDIIKRDRDDRMPPHPASKLFGLPEDYRQAMEHPMIHTHSKQIHLQPRTNKLG
jgi:hypothetical protein